MQALKSFPFPVYNEANNSFFFNDRIATDFIKIRYPEIIEIETQPLTLRPGWVYFNIIGVIEFVF